ncbi:DNA replication complex GINS protein PSF2 [Kluyveromyces marxianus]|uniref:DNA replication complex GINS protein PSF2 n=2 Tax=Kluyveromyces marxianus TaxID=4911 RepID=W0T8Y8_KLUMD|nr:DNA replication complex GINS protein PSF2 [Kluyveromyces marxianus DMKU3-1042]QGN14999.1 DNA replication complex GINS protein PSF2 [Kluyveromyces marxianus]BAO39276.1 DNA replication complex GINS protein PSF2 [Kluyveromyces marxianus DMKU3-1042]BAP70788.1 DNA replication complex GINS protein PSF2 [Kluyveromyces marxianus]
MSLPKNLQVGFSPQEIQFLIENEPIRIMPRITTRKTKKQQSTDLGSQWSLLTCDDTAVNNMVVMNSCEVTIWLALLLKQQGKCNIIVPSWLTLQQLDKYLEYELKNTSRFSNLPWNWLVLSTLLFSRCSDDFKDPVHLLRSKIQDLREVRLGKVNKGLQYLNESHLQLENLSLMEINEMRPYACGIMDKLRTIHDASNDTS